MTARPYDSSHELENAFKQIITAGWNQKSDGDVEAPCGHFATIPITKYEMDELLEAVFGDDRPEVTIEPGFWFAKKDSDGNMWLWCFKTAFEMDSTFRNYQRDFAEWAKPTHYVVCRKCDNQFSNIQEAYEHGTSDPNTKAWCGEDGFDVSEGGVL